MASTNKSATALTDLRYIQSLLLKSKASQRDTATNASDKKTTEKINGATTNATFSDSPHLMGHNETSGKSESGANCADNNDGLSLGTSTVTGSSSRRPTQWAASSDSVDLVDDGVGPPTIDDHYNYNSHVRNSSPRDRKAILDALREKKKIAQLGLQEIEVPKTNIKINIKSVAPSKKVDLNRNDKCKRESEKSTAKSSQCEPLNEFINNVKSENEFTNNVKSENEFRINVKSENELFQHFNNNDQKNSFPNGSSQILDVKSRPKAADFFTPSPATNELESNKSLKKMFKLNPGQRSEISKIFSEMRAKLILNTNKSSASTDKVPASSYKLPASSDKLPASTNKVPASTDKVPASTDKLPASTNKVPASSDKVPASSDKVPASTDKVPASTDKVPASTDKVPASTDKVPASTDKVPASTDKLAVITEKISADVKKLHSKTKKIQVNSDKLPVNTDKSATNTHKSPAITDKLPAITEKSTANTGESTGTAANSPAESNINSLDETKPSDLDDVSSEGSLYGYDEEAAADRLDDVSSSGEIASVGEIEEGEITEDEDMSLSSPRVSHKGSQPQQFEESRRLRVLVVGDSRARDMVTDNGSIFTSAVCYVNDTYDILNFCNKINDMLIQDNQFDVVVIFVYHMNLIFADKVEVAGQDVELHQVRKNISISHLFKVVKVHDKKWSIHYPDTKFIWATPYPVDFIAWNEARLFAASGDWTKTLMKAECRSQASQNYWSCIKDISKNWSMVMSRVKRFPLHVLMLARPSDRKNFRADGSGCFPPGFLINGVRPTERFRQQFAAMFLLYLSETCPSLGVRAIPKNAPFGAIATEVSAWLAESATKPPNLFSNRGECYDDPEIVQTTLQTHRELYTLYHEKPSQHPEYVRQRQMYSWQTSGVQDDELESGWRMHWTKFMAKDFDQTWSHKREELLAQTGSERSNISSRSGLTSSKILISSDSDNTGRRKKETKHSRSRSKSKNSDRSRHRKSRHRSKRSTRDHHKKKKRRRRSISSSDMSSEDETPSNKRRNILDEEEDEDVDIDDLIYKERVNIAKKKEKKTAELKNRKDVGEFSKPISISDSTLPLTESCVISDDSMLPLCNSKAHNSSSVQDVAGYGGLSSTRNDGTDLTSTITVSSEFSSVAHEEKSLKADDVKDNDDKDELSEVGRIGSNHDGVNSSDEEIADFEMDLDIDEKMDELLDDPDFMKDLEKFGDDLESIIDKDQLNNDTDSQDAKEKEGDGMASTESKDDPANLAPGSTICEEDKNTLLNSKTAVERKGNYMVEVLRILNNVSNHFGPLSGSISNMHQKSLECLENAQDPITLLTKNNCAILEVIYSKLKRFIEEPCTPQVHRALYNIAARELRQLLDNPQTDTDMFLGVNIANIAKATLGSDTSRVITFIKNTLMYHGHGEVPKDDVMRIFMAVKSVQLKLLENEERSHQS